MTTSSNAVVVHWAEAQIDQRLARWESSTGRIWDAHRDITRTLISLSSGALVLSIAMVQAFGSQLESTSTRWILVASWVCFCIAILSGTFRLGSLGRIAAYPRQLELLRPQALKEVAGLGTSANAELVGEILQRVLGPADTGADDAVISHNKIAMAMMLSFTTGMILLVVFASLNLPF